MSKYETCTKHKMVYQPDIGCPGCVAEHNRWKADNQRTSADVEPIKGGYVRPLDPVNPVYTRFLPQDAKARKGIPIATGCLDYFPKALAEVAGVSRLGNDQHNPGKPLHWDRTKSTDEADCLIRHFLERGTRDTDGARHSAKVAWRALALLEKEIEADLAKERDAQIEAERREIRDRNTA